MDQRRHSNEPACSALPGVTTPDAATRSGSAEYPLSASTLALLDTLPPTLRLLALRRRYPHVLVRLASRWSDPLAMLTEFRALRGADRPHRSGLPAEVAAEVTQLAEYYFGIVHANLFGLYRGES